MDNSCNGRHSRSFTATTYPVNKIPAMNTKMDKTIENTVVNQRRMGSDLNHKIGNPALSKAIPPEHNDTVNPTAVEKIVNQL